MESGDSGLGESVPGFRPVPSGLQFPCPLHPIPAKTHELWIWRIRAWRRPCFWARASVKAARSAMGMGGTGTRVGSSPSQGRSSRREVNRKRIRVSRAWRRKASSSSCSVALQADSPSSGEAGHRLQVVPDPEQGDLGQQPADAGAADEVAVVLGGGVLEQQEALGPPVAGVEAQGVQGAETGL